MHPHQRAAVGPAAPEVDGGTLVWMHFKATLLK
jgi:hypothetical protein